MWMLVVFAVFFVLFARAEAKNDGDGNDLLKSCNHVLQSIDDPNKLTSIELSQAIACFSYIEGAYEALQLSSILLNEQPLSVRKILPCFQPGGSPRETVGIVMKYLNDHPEQLKMNRELLVWNALRQAYPCK